MRFIRWFGVLSFFIYSLLANYYYLERATMLDNAFQLCEIIRNGDLAIQVNRYLAFFTQIFPFIGYKLGLELDTIARIYTLSFPIIYGLCFVLIAFVFSNKRISILFLLYHYLIVSHSFFWPQCELVQGVSWFFVYVALLEWLLVKVRFNWFTIFFGLVFLVSLVFMHPLLFFVGTFYFANQILKDVKNRKFYLIQFVALITITIVKKLFFENAYDDNFTKKLLEFISNFSQERKGIKIETIYSNFISNYIFLNLYLTIGFCYLLYIKKWWQSALMLFYSVGFLLLIYIAYEIQMDLFYAEVQYYLISLFISVVLIDYFSFQSRPTITKLFLIVLIIGFCFRVINVSRIYTKRLAYLDSIVNKYYGEKVLLKEDHYNRNILKLSWGSSFETWLLSTIRKGKSSSIIVTYQSHKYLNDLNKKNSWITEWETIDYDKLNPKYFLFKDTSCYVLK